jgi:cation diffusion facilitator CzcD-associated flavoprotein CzcO
MLGEPMQFWHKGMPEGMLLRSGDDWQLDPEEKLTYREHARRHSLPLGEPIPLLRFVDYANALAGHYQLTNDPRRAVAITREQTGYQVRLEDGEVMRAARVAICVGFGPFPNQDHALARHPQARHTSQVTDLSGVRGRRLLILGGRQSAFEYAALAAEAGAARVQVVYRHPTPSFVASDWSWVDALIERARETPGWYAALPQQQRDSIARRFWEEGRLKLEPWLAPRLQRPEIELYPQRQVVGFAGDQFRLDDGSELEADQILLATGYRIDLSRLSYLNSLLPQIATQDGFPILDERFTSSLPGLHFTSLASTRCHGPFFGFVRGCVPCAQSILP